MFAAEFSSDQKSANSLGNGAPGRTRTFDPRLRRPVRYPSELRDVDARWFSAITAPDAHLPGPVTSRETGDDSIAGPSSINPPHVGAHLRQVTGWRSSQCLTEARRGRPVVAMTAAIFLGSATRRALLGGEVLMKELNGDGAFTDR